MNVLYGSVYPFYHRNPKAPNYKGKCTLELDGREIELELAIWNRDYGLSLNGTLIRLVDTVPTKKQKMHLRWIITHMRNALRRYMRES